MRARLLPSLLRIAAAAAATTTTTRPQAKPTKLRLSAGRWSTIPLLGSLAFSSSAASMAPAYPDGRTEQEWQAVLSKEQFRVLRQKGTEPAFTGAYDQHYPAAGVYRCAGCDAPLYTARHKFKSGCGWPAYFDSVPGAVTRHTDNSHGMARTEIVCSNCGGHLGHVFNGEGFPTPTDERHCVNSVSLRFSDDGDDDAQAKAGNGPAK